MPEDDGPEQTAPARTRQEPRFQPGEFERFVQSVARSREPIRRLGSGLVTGEGEAPPMSLAAAAELNPLVPPDYVIGPGDELLLALWGSVEADLRLTVDRSGRIAVPRVGTIQVSGVPYSELPEVVRARVSQVFRNFSISVSLGQLRGIRVFATGFVAKPGNHTVSSLSSVLSVLMRAGGPTAAGGFRDIELRRGGATVAKLDLYDLLLKGDRSADRVVQAGDVVHVGAVGTQIGFVGSVNQPAVVEIRPGETVADALRMVAGFTAVADRTRLAIERLEDRNAGRVAEIRLPEGEGTRLSHGDVLRAFSAVAVALPSERQSKRVRVEGEVNRPAEYVLPVRSTLRDAIRAAGGFTGAAYVFATEFTRESVQRTQKENYDRVLRDLETDLARAASTQRVASAEEAAGSAGRLAATDRLIERLRVLRPNGRIVLHMEPDTTDLPDLALEDGDRILIPSRPTTVGVFGSVFNAATYLHAPGQTIDDYMRLAGGPTKGADESSVFVVRANGHVISGRQQSSSFWRSSHGVERVPAQAGDTIFVPEEMDKVTFLQRAKDWTQVLYQLGIGLAAFQVFRTN
jgi:protein involved in polysaccharide export with SLBB domain